jgi:signal transduction histidine kinase
MRYGIAILATAAALLVRWALNPVLGGHVPYITLLPAVAFAAWYCGAGPAVVSVAVALVGAQYGIVSPHSLHIAGSEQFLGILLFLLVSAVLIAMAETRRRENEKLRIAQGELEERVRQRTADLDVANRGLRDLTARLMQSQDDERRRIARELHDSIGQLLAGVTMNLSAVRTDLEQLFKTANTLADSEALIQEMNREVRTISHLLHPPLLDEAGLASALHWYVDGFTERSSIKVELEFPEDMERLSQETETAIFRMVQECLTNIHRHAKSPTARIRIMRTGSEVRVEVADQGQGIPAEKQREMATLGNPGVGVRGMRERLRQLGGSLAIDSGNQGTTVTARLPVTNSSSSSSPATSVVA